jgi:hypothetical protein
MNKRQVIALFLVSALEGVIAAIFVFGIPSETGNAWLWGFSKARVALGGGILFAALVLLSIALFIYLDDRRASMILKKLDGFLTHDDHLLIVLLTLIDFWIFTLLFILAAHIPMGNLSPFAIRAQSAGLWTALIILQAIGFLAFAYREKIREPNFWNGAALKQTSLVLMLISFAFVQWMILIFRIPVFSSLYGWYWKFIFKTDYYYFDWLIPLIFMLFILLAGYYLKHPKVTFVNLLPLVIFGALLQFGFAFIEGGSFEVLRESYAKSPHKFYAEYASTGPGIMETIHNYESLLGQGNFASTKPPGLVGLYILLEKVSFAINPSSLAHERFFRLTRLIAWIFPIVSMVVIYPLSWLGKRFLDEKNAIIPALLYLCLPNVLLIQLYMDQTLYPLLFVLAIWLIIIAVDKKAILYAIMAGLLLYLSIFVSFSLIPAIFIAFILIGMHGLFAWTGYSTSIGKVSLSASNLWGYIRLGLGVLFGMGVLYLFFQTLLNYNVFERYSNAIAIHRELKNYDTGLGGFLPAALLNISDYGVWTGTSILILSVLAVFGSLARILKKSLSDFDWLSLSFMVTFMAINIAGQTGGETGRLWIFLSPVFAILAAEQAPRIFKKRESGVYLVIILQLITVVLTLKFQDFFGG